MASFFWWLTLKGNPSPKKWKKGTTGQLGFGLVLSESCRVVFGTGSDLIREPPPNSVLVCFGARQFLLKSCYTLHLSNKVLLSCPKDLALKG